MPQRPKSSKYRYRWVENLCLKSFTNRMWKICVWNLLRIECQDVLTSATPGKLPAQDHSTSLPTYPLGLCEMRFGLGWTAYLKSYAIVPLHELVGQNHRQCIPLADHQIAITLDEPRAVGLPDQMEFLMCIYTKHGAVHLYVYPCKIWDRWHCTESYGELWASEYETNPSLWNSAGPSNSIQIQSTELDSKSNYIDFGGQFN